MCEKCDIENERQRLTNIALSHPKPCLVCGEENIVGAGTWIPDESRRLAIGGPKDTLPIFAFCLCNRHAEATQENEKIIKQTIVRYVQAGKAHRLY